MTTDLTTDIVPKGAQEQDEGGCLSNLWDSYKWIILGVLAIIVIVLVFYFWKKRKGKKAVAPNVAGTAIGASVPVELQGQGGNYALNLQDDRGY